MIRGAVLAFLLAGCMHPTAEWMRAFAPLSAETVAEKECRAMTANPSRSACMWLPKRSRCVCQEMQAAPTMERPFYEEAHIVNRNPCGEVLE